jgi:hypothetical protein
MTAKADSHVSTFALDVYWASGRAPDAEVEEHLAMCARCQAYLASLEALGDVSFPAPVRPRNRRAARWALPSAVGTALALAACVLLLVRTRSAERSYVGAKGTPAVQVLVHREADTWIWDGRSPVHPGDALALRVACEGLEHVAVASPEGGRWERIADATCPVGEEPLPFTLVVDAVPGSESVAVVLSRTPLDDDALRAAIARERRSEDVWFEGFVLPKLTESGR